MNWTTIENSWKDYSNAAQQQWNKLSLQQVSETHGKQDQLCAQVQKAYSVSKEDAEKQINEWQSRQVAKPAPAKS